MEYYINDDGTIGKVLGCTSSSVTVDNQWALDTQKSGFKDKTAIFVISRPGKGNINGLNELGTEEKTISGFQLRYIVDNLAKADAEEIEDTDTEEEGSKKDPKLLDKKFALKWNAAKPEGTEEYKESEMG